MSDATAARNVEVTASARTFFLGGKQQPTPITGRTPVLLIQGDQKALDEVRALLERQERAFAIDVAKW